MFEIVARIKEDGFLPPILPHLNLWVSRAKV